MVHIGCGADIIRQRRRNQQLQREAEAQGIFVGVKDWKPAKNHKYPHYTPARDKDVFNNRKCSHMRVQQRRKEDSVTKSIFSRGSSLESKSSTSSVTSSRSVGINPSNRLSNVIGFKSNSTPKLCSLSLNGNLALGSQAETLSDRSQASMTPSPSSSRTSPGQCSSRLQPPFKQSGDSNESNTIETSQNENLSLTKSSFVKPKILLSQIGRQNAILKCDNSVGKNPNEDVLSTNFRRQLSFKKGGCTLLKQTTCSESSTPKRKDSSDSLNLVKGDKNKELRSPKSASITKNKRLSVDFSPKHVHQVRRLSETQCNIHYPLSRNSFSIEDDNGIVSKKANLKKVDLELQTSPYFQSKEKAQLKINPDLLFESTDNKSNHSIHKALGSFYTRGCKLHDVKKTKFLEANQGRNGFYYVAVEVHVDSEDYDPLEILEKDVFLYKDFCLPNHFASQEDTSIV